MQPGTIGAGRMGADMPCRLRRAGHEVVLHDVDRVAALGEGAVNLVDCGTSGGVHGIGRGYCLMIGGEVAPVERPSPIFEGRSGEASSVEPGFMHCGPTGAGHSVKTVHNGIDTASWPHMPRVSPSCGWQAIRFLRQRRGYAYA